METAVIIGGGIAGLTAAETIRQNNQDVEIILICGEDYLPYNRIKLSKFLCQEFNATDLLIHKSEWYSDKNIKVMLSATASKINHENNELILQDGRSIQYTNLIIANGSSSFIPPFPGASKSGVFVVRTINDVLNINKYMACNNIKNAVVIGGGLLGIEAAWSLKRSGSSLNISIIENMQRLLPRQMDEEGSIVLEDLMFKNNINLYKGLAVKEIHGDKKVNFVELADSTKVDADMVIVSAGIRSNISIAKNCGLNTDKGIIVDSSMRTNYHNIFAAGDTAEYKKTVLGIWQAAMEQGRIAGLNASGIYSEYKEITPSNLLQVMDVNVFSVGDVSGSYPYIKYDTGIYSKIYHNNGVICGAVLIGDTKKGFYLKKAIDQKTDFSKEISNGINILS